MAGCAGVAAAAIVGFEIAADAWPPGHVDQQIGGAHGCPGCQRAPNVHAWDVRQQQQTAFERRVGDDIARIEPAQDVGRHPRRDMRRVVHVDLAVTALDYGDRQRTVLNILLGQISLREEIAAGVIEIGDARRELAELQEIQAALGPVAACREQRTFGEEGLPGHPQRMHRDRRAGGHIARRDRLWNDQIRGGFDGRERLRQLLQLGARIGDLLRISDVGRREQRECDKAWPDHVISELTRYANACPSSNWKGHT